MTTDRFRLQHVIRRYIGPTDRRSNAGYQLADIICGVVATMTNFVEFDDFIRGMKQALDRALRLSEKRHDIEEGGESDEA